MLFRQIKDFAITKTTADNDDFLILQNPTTGETYKITKADFLAGLSSGSSGGGTSGVPLSFLSSGDTNGLFYYLGTEKLTVSFSSPSERGVTLTANGVAYGSPTAVVDRSDGSFFFPPESQNGSWVVFHLTEGALKCNYYSIKTRVGYGGYYPRNWKFQGSTDGNTWIDLDIQNENQTLNSDGQWLSLPVSTNTSSYNYFRLITTGNDSSGAKLLVLNEVELYGTYFE